MLFTMTIPFLEVVYHTSNEMLKQSEVVRVTPQNWSEEDEMPNTSNDSKAQFLRKTQSLVLPTSSLLFTLIFWIVGIIASYNFAGSQDSRMSDCLTIDLN